ncbi:DASS family sodium-coupled anion symporter [Candidatus Marinimicrobia bacterium]|nr:DASS family sodium-coupled anion symporter [Candidatus Neomarinimicrobiota bacterium]
MSRKQMIGFGLGLSSFLFLISIEPPNDMNPLAIRAAAVSIMMAIFWVTEAISIFATSFLPIVLFPLLGVLDSKQIAASYGHHIVLLILGAFFVAKAIETNHLHKRIALATIKSIGTSRPKVMLSFMIATGFLSMWTSNNSTTLMMLPIGLAIISREKELGADTKRFAPALMLSIAYSASIGGTGTLVGTPPNLVFVSTAQELLPNSPDILFTDWLKIGIPFVVLFLPIAWIYIVKFFNVSGDLQGSSNVIQKEYTDLGEMSLAEKKVLIVVLLYAFGFIFRDSWSSFLGVSGFVKDSTVAFFAAIALFSLSSGRTNKDGEVERLLEWKDAQDIPWAIGMLIGGGLAIASAFKSSGLVEWIGENLILNDIPISFIVIAVVAAMVFLTEINSNTATTAVFLPVLAGVSDAGNFHPFLLMVPATIAASCAFMLPSGTGPNASVLASGQLTIPQMARAGFGLNLIAIFFIFILFYFILFPIMNIV